MNRLPMTERTRRAIALAEQEAKRLGDSHLGCEHIMLGILAERHNVAASVLRDLGVAERVAHEIVRLVKGDQL